MVDLGTVVISGNYINSANYVGTVNTPSSILVYDKYDSTLTPVTAFGTNDYKLGENIQLEYNISGDNIIVDGFISIHKVIHSGSNQIDEVLYTSTGNVLYTHTLIDVGAVSFYASFAGSVDYKDATSATNIINIIAKYSPTNTLTTQLSIQYGDEITLNSDLAFNSDTINQGIVEFYIIRDSVSETIGTAEVYNNNASIQYIVNRTGNVTFSSIFKNSFDYANTTATSISNTVNKRNITQILVSATTPTIFDIVQISATLSFEDAICYSNLGNVTFAITNNLTTTSTIVDIFDNVAIYNLYITDSTNYSITATFNGNDGYNSMSSNSISLTPTITNNKYDSLHYSTTPIAGVTNYIIVNASIILKTSAVDLFVLNNSGFIHFEQINGLNAINSKYIPLVNGSASLVMRSETGYTYNVSYVDNILTPKINITGTRAI